MGALAAVALGASVGPLCQPQPAQAATIRELSWYLDAMHVEEAHRISTGKGVTVAVVDTGVDASHPDLRGHVLEGREMGRKRDAGAKAQTDEDGHGTGMASLIAGRGDRGENSLLGVAPDAKILPVRIAQNSEGAFRPEDVYEGVRWAIDQGAEVVNISLGGERSSDGPWKEQLVDYAIKHDVILVAAAGNTGQGDKQVAEPASIPGVVAVSGLAHDGSFWDGSAKGPEVVVSAPGEELPHAVPTSVSESGYALADGTSGATALVSGVSALIRDAFPDATVNDVVNRLIRTAEDRGDAGRDDEYGFGAVDARAALEGEVPKVKHHPLLSPEAAASDEAAAAAKARRGTSDSTVALIVVGVFIGSTVLLIVGWYLIFLARRSSQVVVAGVVPGHQATPVTGFSWGPGPPQAQVVDGRAGPMSYPPP
ncbi:MAG: type VII secretion-associated serine protease mycosin, partial [Micromonosporaceae bacterium]